MGGWVGEMLSAQWNRSRLLFIHLLSYPPTSFFPSARAMIILAMLFLCACFKHLI